MGDQAPNFLAETLAGERIDFEQYRGKVVVLDFWSTSAEGYAEEVSSRLELQSEVGDKNFAIIGVCLDNVADRARSFLSRYEGANWPQVFDGNSWSGEVVKLGYM